MRPRPPATPATRIVPGPGQESVWDFPRAAFADGVLVEAPGSSVCEFKGTGRYLDLRVGDTVARRAAWYYPEPWPGYEQLRDRVALYPGAMDSCEVDGESVIPQEGGFYGAGSPHAWSARSRGDPGPSAGDRRDAIAGL